MVLARFHLLLLPLALASPPAPSRSPLSELVSWSLGLDAKQDDGQFPRHCTCQPPVCQCCVDFNMSYVDLGGPGCVSVKYKSPTEGFSVNVTYGDNQLHSAVIQGKQVEVTCMNLLSELAQICARFTPVEESEQGPASCASLEPTLLGDPQQSYHLGCFRLSPSAITLIPYRPVPTNSSVEETEESGEGLVAAVSETAEEGIAWLSSLLGLELGGLGAGQPAPGTGQAAPAPVPAPAPAQPTSVDPSLHQPLTQ